MPDSLVIYPFNKRSVRGRVYREIVHLCLQHKQHDPLGVVLLFRLSRIAATAKDLVLDQMTNKTSPPLFCGLA